MRKASQLQQGTNLADQLDTYSASVRANHTAGSWSKRIQRWTPYAAAVGSSLALTTAADAAIIYSGLKNISYSGGEGTYGGQITVGSHVGVFSLILRHTDGGRLGHVSGSARVIHPNNTHGGVAPAGLIENSSGHLKRLASGAQITSRANFQGLPGPLKYQRIGGGSGGTWPANQTGFAGIEFATKNTGGAQIDFGWIRLEWNPGSGVPRRITAIDWAYDNTGNSTGIVAGQESAVPEPSSLLLTMLAAGSAGVLAWRNRRQAAAKAAAAPSEPTA